MEALDGCKIEPIRLLWIAALLSIAGIAAAGCQRSCPTGATLRGGPPPKASAQWCERRPSIAQAIPVPGQSYNNVLGIGHPAAHSGLSDGPQTEWHPNGTVKSHGRFAVTPAGTSVPHGVWTFWYPSGQRRSEGHYNMGEPVGCFGSWDEDGTLHTVAFRDGAFRATNCHVARNEHATALAAHYAELASGVAPPTRLGGEAFSVALGYEIAASPIPIQSDELAQGDASIQENLRISLRRKLGAFKLGAAGSARATERFGTWTASAGALASYSIPPAIDAVDAELSAEIGARAVSIRPDMNGLAAADRERFWLAHGAAQAALGIRLASALGLYAAFAVERDLSREVERHSTFCYPIGCAGVDASWTVGGTTYGLVVELRFLVR